MKTLLFQLIRINKNYKVNISKTILLYALFKFHEVRVRSTFGNEHRRMSRINEQFANVDGTQNSLKSSDDMVKG